MAVYKTASFVSFRVFAFGKKTEMNGARHRESVIITAELEMINNILVVLKALSRAHVASSCAALERYNARVCKLGLEL